MSVATPPPGELKAPTDASAPPASAKNGNGHAKTVSAIVACVALAAGGFGFAFSRASRGEVERAEERCYPRRDGEQLEEQLRRMEREQSEIKGDVRVIRALLERERGGGGR